MARTDERGRGASVDEAPDAGVEDARGSSPESSSERTSSVRPIRPAVAGDVQDEAERTRLIGDITRLICEPSMPECTRVAGLTLIGWLARRRPNEVPHAIGIEEARESERRIRTKAR